MRGQSRAVGCPLLYLDITTKCIEHVVKGIESLSSLGLGLSFFANRSGISQEVILFQSSQEQTD